MSEKHNHSLSSINLLLEKKNHCIMIVSLFNKAITYVNQQTEEKNCKDAQTQLTRKRNHHDTTNITQSSLH